MHFHTEDSIAIQFLGSSFLHRRESYKTISHTYDVDSAYVVPTG